MRLIDADKIEWIVAKVAFVNEETGEEANTEKKEVAATFKDWVDEIPTVDTEPVVHAKWEHIIERKPIYDERDIEAIIEEPKTRCSCCKRTNKQYEPPYCPHCGARMDEEVENETECRTNKSNNCGTE